MLSSHAARMRYRRGGRTFLGTGLLCRNSGNTTSSRPYRSQTLLRLSRHIALEVSFRGAIGSRPPPGGGEHQPGRSSPSNHTSLVQIGSIGGHCNLNTPRLRLHLHVPSSDPEQQLTADGQTEVSPDFITRFEG